MPDKKSIKITNDFSNQHEIPSKTVEELINSFDKIKSSFSTLSQEEKEKIINDIGKERFEKIKRSIGDICEDNL